MLAIALFGVAFAGCGLPASIDPAGDCVTDANEFSVLDADTSDSIPISLSIHTKGSTTDAFSVVHGATQGTLADDTADDGRYVLACKQAEGYKTVMMTVTRPRDLTAFGGEWVQLFPKDSWSNTRSQEVGGRQAAGHDTSFLSKLVLGCIETKFCNQIRIFSGFSRSTKLSTCS